MLIEPGATPLSPGYQDPSVEVPLEDVETLHKKVAALRKILDDKEVKAKYKIELRFGKARSINGLTPGMVSFWHHGTKFHGGGDEKMYLCPGNRLKKSGCERPLPQVSIAMGFVICPYCGITWKGEQVVGEL